MVLVERTSSQYSETWFGMRGDEHVVLKSGDARARRREAEALRLYEGVQSLPAARILQAEDGVLLLERLLLGDDLRPLARLDDDAATRIIAGLIGDLQSAELSSETELSLPDVSSLGDDLEWYARQGGGQIPAAVFELAAGWFEELTGTETQQRVVLHGDLHHQNVLRSGQTWRAIDPHGWIGDPAFDAVAMMLNPYDVLAAAESRGGLVDLAERRAALVGSALSVPSERILRWTAVGAVISEIWCLQDHGFVQGIPLRLAQHLLNL